MWSRWGAGSGDRPGTVGARCYTGLPDDEEKIISQKKIIKVLTATARTQGDRDNDYHWCIEGELVHIGAVCARDQADPDGGCGCGRGFAGLNSHRATTTAAVTDVPLSLAEYTEAIRSSLEQQGYDPGYAADEADGLLELVAEWPVGAVVERRLWELSVRCVNESSTRCQRQCMNDT